MPAKNNTEAEIGFQAQILAAVERLPNGIKFPDGSNRGKLFGLLALWKKVSSITDGKYEALLKELTANELVKDPKSISVPGNHNLGKAGKLEVVCNVSQARREFDVAWFAAELQKGYKVPTAVTLALLEAAKRPGSSHTRTLSVTEAGVKI